MIDLFDEVFQGFNYHHFLELPFPSIGYYPEPLQIRMGCAESRTAPEPDDESDLPLKKSSYSASELRRSIVSINKDHDINTVYDCDTGSRVMGSGATATVKTIRHRKTGVEYALKSIRLNRMDSKFNVQCFPVVVFVCSVPLMWVLCGCLSSNHPILISGIALFPTSNVSINQPADCPATLTRAPVKIQTKT